MHRTIFIANGILFVGAYERLYCFNVSTYILIKKLIMSYTIVYAIHIPLLNVILYSANNANYIIKCNSMAESCQVFFNESSIYSLNFDGTILATISYRSLTFWNVTNNLSLLNRIAILALPCDTASWSPNNLLVCTSTHLG